MIAVYHVLWGDTFLAGTDGDGHTVFIRTSDKQYLAFFQSEIAHIDISGYIHTCQMTNMHTAVSVWQRRRHRRTFVSLVLHSLNSYLLFANPLFAVLDHNALIAGIHLLAREIVLRFLR